MLRKIRVVTLSAGFEVNAVLQRRFPDRDEYWELGNAPVVILSTP